MQPDAAEDQAAIEAVLRGETDAFAVLVDKYQTTAIRTAFGILGNEQDARDAAQEAFVSAYKSLGSFHGRSRFSTWLYRIVVNKCWDMGRKRAREPAGRRRVAGGAGADSGMFTEIDSGAATPDHTAVRNEIAEAFELALAELPYRQRTAFVLHHLQGMDQNEVAETMHCRTGTVKAHVFRATRALKRSLSPWLEEV